MRPQYDAWRKASHHQVAVCVDCHRPHAFPRSGSPKPQAGSRLHCHAAIMPLYRELGGGDAMRSFEESFKFTYQDLNARLHASEDELNQGAEWRLDFIAAENSMGSHAPQEAARVLGEAIDYAGQGQVAALRAKSGPLL